MNPREKILAIAVGGIVVVFAGGFGLKALWAKPLKEIDKKTAVLREKLDKLKAERRAYFEAEDLVKRYTQRMFADEVDQASAKSGELLTKTILQCGLPEMDFTRLPAGPRRISGANEIGWSVQGEGKLRQILDLLFLLQETPYLHRIDNLVLSPGESPADVHAGFRFLTLVLAPAPVVDLIELKPKYTLESSERLILDGIVKRDLLRPYIKRMLVPAPGTRPAQPGTPVSPGIAPGPESFKIVSLSEWMGQPEVHVRDLTNQRTMQYRIGDSLAGGVIVLVDYRPMPTPGNEGLQSFSRVILRIGSEYFAIERGKTFADKYKLAAAQLPEQLAKVVK